MIRGWILNLNHSLKVFQAFFRIPNAMHHFPQDFLSNCCKCYVGGRGYQHFPILCDLWDTGAREFRELEELPHVLPGLHPNLFPTKKFWGQFEDVVSSCC